MKHLSLYSGRWIATFILCIGMVIHANAQTFTDRVQQKAEGKGTVTIHQSAEIDQLLNDPTATDIQQQSATNTNKQAEPSKANTQQASKSAPSKPTTQQASSTTESNDTQQRLTGSRKVIGYRVQAFAGGNSRKDRQAAEQARNNIKAQIPGVAVDVHFYSPRWICRVGNYRTYEEAHQMMVKLQNMGYKQATIVKGKITISY